MARNHGRAGDAGRAARAVLPALAAILLAATPPAARADDIGLGGGTGVPTGGSGATAEACARHAAAVAERAAQRARLPSSRALGEEIGAAATEGAIIGGLGGRAAPGSAWSPGGAARGARLGGGLATLDALSQAQAEAGQAAYDAAFAACMAGHAAPAGGRPGCGSSGVVVSGGGRGAIGTSSRNACD